MEDYYGQLKFIRPDLFPSWKAFSEQYLVIEMVTYPGREEDPFPKIVGYKNQSHFQQILKTISSRRTRDEVANTVTISRNIREIVAPSEAFLTHYRALETELYTLVSTGMVSAANALVKASKLHQVCGGFVKDDNGEVHQVNQDKLDHLWKLIDRALPVESFVVVANYKAEMTAISEGLTARGISNKQIRGGKAHQYDPHDRSRVTILNPSAGEAINLSHHDHMIIFSMNFSFLKWSQFKDRIVLLDKPQVKYYYILMKETIDELVYKAVLEKKKMSDEILRVFSTSS